MIASHSASWHGKAWVSPGFGVFLGQVGNHDWHRHMAHQITIGINHDLTVTTPGSHVTARAICIQAGVTHRIEAVEVISIYLDALSEEARAFTASTSILPIDVQSILSLQTLLATPCITAQKMRGAVRQFLNLTDLPIIDPRLQLVLEALNEPTNGRQELADLMHLSTTRFSHWFVEQTGLPLRSYRKWLRLVAALQLITAGQSLTGAAHAAGFSDSAHFSRTFRSLFGLDPSSALSQVSLSS
ncbi:MULTISPECIES: helix-turn-helix transcriptional regulator [unclassified Pseudomonas]|uniref:AraC family transcriptional regulator n=1 Tax=unclassified Pseudomonas TaxID=196821 RepID=UPI002449553F|nr:MULTISPECIES: helix-turn-helix transcriptional regulator [unclassified Pseudomonas]MDG9926070.1 helix-turn-helix transcriptional regulator [Pseudomonas sp. GD04045]MDH0037120.1 helix-turn-helix transcriptional regulator [Pseudomonas sp. GD04019]